MAKRTIYARWTGKPALFHTVLERLMERWLAAAGDWAEAETLEAALDGAATRILAVALTPEAVALHRLLIAESARFPELPLMMHQAGAGEGTRASPRCLTAPSHGDAAEAGHGVSPPNSSSTSFWPAPAPRARPRAARSMNSRRAHGARPPSRMFLSGIGQPEG